MSRPYPSPGKSGTSEEGPGPWHFKKVNSVIFTGQPELPTAGLV